MLSMVDIKQLSEFTLDALRARQSTHGRACRVLKGLNLFAYASILSGFGVSHEAKSLKEVQMLISC